MEKYSKWRDKATSLHPFLPPQSKGENPLIKYILGPIVAISRMSIMTAFMCFFIPTVYITELMPGIIRNTLLRFELFFGCRFLLLLLGFWWIPAKYHALQRRNPLPKVWPPGANIGAKEIIIANKSSFIEYLYLAFRFGPQFTATVNSYEEFPTENNLKEVSFFAGLKDCFYNTKRVAKDCTTINDIMDSSQRPIVVFPEGTTSNGKALLQYLPVFKNIKATRYAVHPIAFKYQWHGYCPSFTVGNSFWHVFRLCSQLNNTLHVRYLSPSDIGPNPTVDKVDDGEVAFVDEEEWAEDLWKKIAMLFRFKQTKMNLLDKQEFIAYWNEAQSSSYTKKHA